MEFRTLGKAGCSASRLGFGSMRLPEVYKRKREDMPSIPIGLQLYSVRDDCARDLPGTLAEVARMGYAGVEFAGYHGRNSRELRQMLDDLGLACCGSHLQLEALLGDELARTVEFSLTLGNRFLIVASLPPERVPTRAAWLEHARIFAELASKVREHGLRVGYHNHAVEFQPLEGERPWDTLFGHTSREVIMQLDTGNARRGGGDPVATLRRYPGRAITVHLKEYGGAGGRAIVGEGDTPWRDILGLCESTGGTEWYIVEQASPAHRPLECVRLCLQALRAMGK